MPRTPFDDIRKLEKLFQKEYPSIERKRQKKFLPFVFPVLLVLGMIAFFLFPERKESPKQKPKITQKEEEQKEKIGCVLAVDYDDEVIGIILDLGVKNIKIINRGRETRNIINLYIGDFKSFDDAAIVSSRLNDKLIPNRIEKKDGSWRVYITSEMPEIKSYEIKLKITPADISQIEKIASAKFREIVKAEVVKKQKITATVILELEDKENCKEVIKALKAKGKSVSGGILVGS